jgi:tetraacyldisaccharide 4'-kinase
MREWFRNWTESAETFILEVIFEQRRGKRAAITRFLLLLLSNVFAVAVKLRRFLYNVRLLRDSTLGVQVIAIGNLTVGGTGKTPVVEKFARELTDAGRTVAILSRGYRSKPPPLRQRLINKLLLREDTTTASRCSWIRKRPVTNPTCWPPISRTSSCSWTRTA